MNVTMDRYDADWDIVKRGWDAHVLGKAPHTFKDALTAVTTLRGEGDKLVTDQVGGWRQAAAVIMFGPACRFIGLAPSLWPSQ